jgi:hypothetical protein
VKFRQTLTVAAVVAAAAVPSADAMSVNHLVKKAHGKPYACDMDHDGRWGSKQVQCVIIVVMPARWERWALRVGKCESNYNHRDKNRSSSASGVFQFLDSTWRTTPQYKAAYRAARRRGASPSSAARSAARKVFHPVLNTQGAYWLVRTSGPSQWSCR